MAYVVTGTAGNDTLNQQNDNGPGTIVGLAGDDSILQGSGSAQIFGNSGNDTVVTKAGNTKRNANCPLSTSSAKSAPPRGTP